MGEDFRELNALLTRLRDVKPVPCAEADSPYVVKATDLLPESDPKQAVVFPRVMR